MELATSSLPAIVSQQERRREALCERVAEQEAADRDAIGFSTRIFAQVCLPHRDPGPDLPAWIARNGSAVLTVQPGVRANPDGSIASLGYPWGSTPRLVLLYIASEAVRNRRPEIDLGGNFATFLRRIGLSQHSYHYRAVREQMVRLFNANIRFSFLQQDHLEVMSNRPVADDYVLWWDTARPDQHTLWRSYVILHGRFFKDVLEHGFPIDLDAVRAIHQSALALDLYTWVAYRTHTLRRSVRVPWRLLHEQVGSSYADPADFKKRAKRALLAVRNANRRLNFDFVCGALMLKPSLPPVLPQPRS
jgi:hypothetical protein